MDRYSDVMAALVDQVGRLPGIGRKTAQRIAYHIIEIPETDTEKLISAIQAAKTSIRRCRDCGTYTDRDVCRICADAGRDRSQICVVETAKDIDVIEATGRYQGLYHVLGGVIAPLEGKNPKDLNIQRLIARIQEHHCGEVIIALNFSAEADVTTAYLARLLAPLGVRTTRLAQGLPMGSHLEYADSYSVLKSLEGRTALAD